jgi:hypothetical protein
VYCTSIGIRHSFSRNDWRWEKCKGVAPMRNCTAYLSVHKNYGPGWANQAAGKMTKEVLLA